MSYLVVFDYEMQSDSKQFFVERQADNRHRGTLSSHSSHVCVNLMNFYTKKLISATLISHRVYVDYVSMPW